MMIRQTDYPKKKMLENQAKSKDKQVSTEVTKQLMIRAYDIPLHTLSVMKECTIRDFAEEAYLECKEKSV